MVRVGDTGDWEVMLINGTAGGGDVGVVVLGLANEDIQLRPDTLRCVVRPS